MHLAQASVAFPKTPDGDRFRAAVPAIISLQATALALQGIDQLEQAERGVGIDRATVLLAKHAAELHTLWKGEQLPITISELLSDAQTALTTASQSGVLIIIVAQPMALPQPLRVAQIMLAGGFAGTLWLAGPGVTIGPDSPVAFIRGPRGASPESAVLDMLADALTREADCAAVAAPKPLFERLVVPRAVQVYRSREPRLEPAQTNATEVVDTFAWFDDALPAGRPLLVPVLEAGGTLPAPNPALFAGLNQPAERVQANPVGKG